MFCKFAHFETQDKTGTIANADGARQTLLKDDVFIDLHLSRLTLPNNSSRQSEHTESDV